MAGRDYTDLIAWQKSMDLAQELYRATARFPKEEMYGLTSQLRRAAVSVPSNIAEGQGRRTTGAFLQHLSIAHGSLRETETQMLLAARLGYLSDKAAASLMKQAGEVGRLITGLANSLSRSSAEL
jgi:four helix bundle protein